VWRYGPTTSILIYDMNAADSALVVDSRNASRTVNVLTLFGCELFVHFWTILRRQVVNLVYTWRVAEFIQQKRT
jgi:hypothetical protein